MAHPTPPTSDVLRDALSEAHIPSLVAALVSITGDVSLLDMTQRPVFDMLAGDPQGALTVDDQAEVRARALPILTDFFAGDGTLPVLPGATIRLLLDYIAGEAVPEHYVPFLMEELSLAGDARSAVAVAGTIVAHRPDMKVVIIGAGMSGLLAGYRLAQAGVAFEILEKNPEVGGTWYENHYPGCRVDAQNHLYSYSFEPNYGFPNHFSTSATLFDYFQTFADRHDLRRHTRFGVEVVEATYDEAAANWQVRTRASDGREETRVVDAVISAVGQLNRPAYPDIPGIDDFAGTSFHSATWRHDVDLRGKRVAVIGTGASAMQFVPEIADQPAELLVFQRTPPWIVPTPDYHDGVGAGKKWLLEHLPTYGKWYRFWLFWMLTDGLYAAVKADPDWKGADGTISELNVTIQSALADAVRGQLPDDPALAEAMIPSYPFGGKRALRDNGGWAAALGRDNTTLVTDPIAAISADGIVMKDGTTRPVDVIIYGTGFQASRFLTPIRVKGRGGVELHDQWGDDARAYLGMMVPNFPNFFCLYGPNTNIVVNGSIIFLSECSVRYIVGCLALLATTGADAMEIRQDVHDRFNEEVDRGNAQMAWGQAGVKNWYKSATGRVSQNWPFPLVSYWERTVAPDPDDFIFDGATDSADRLGSKAA